MGYVVPMSTNATLDVPDVALRLHCSEWFVRKLIRDGALPASKPARRWIVETSDVDAYIASRSTQAPAQQVTTRRRRRWSA